MQVANPNRAQFTKCAGYAIPYTTNATIALSVLVLKRASCKDQNFSCSLVLFI